MKLLRYLAAFLLLTLIVVSCGEDTAQQAADLKAAETMTFWGWVHLHTFAFIVGLLIVVGGISQIIYHAGNAIARILKGPTPEMHLYILHDGGQSITLNLSQDEIREIIAGRRSLNPEEG